jgi:hypothetical protein
MEAARMAANLLLARWANQGVNLWAVDLVTTPLVTGQSTYAVDPTTVTMLDAYIVSGGRDRIILPVSRTEYASYPDKEKRGVPTVFWFDRQLSPTVTVWPVPDVYDAPKTLKYYRVRRLQDAQTAGGATVEIPWLWMEAFAYGLAQRLAQIWNPQMLVALKPFADESYQIAAEQNIEQAATYISPQIGSYFRP